jgi:hypothetical protein
MIALVSYGDAAFILSIYADLQPFLKQLQGTGIGEQR